MGGFEGSAHAENVLVNTLVQISTRLSNVQTVARIALDGVNDIFKTTVPDFISRADYTFGGVIAEAIVNAVFNKNFPKGTGRGNYKTNGETVFMKNGSKLIRKSVAYEGND